MDTNFWESLRLGFTQLRADCAINPPVLTAGRLTAIWFAQPEPAHWRLDHWKKKDGNGVTERFKWHAQSAAARQGFPGTGDDAVSFWLDQIRRHAPKSHIRQLSVEGEGPPKLYSFELLDICGLSADYCRKCEADETRSGMAPINTPDGLPELPSKFQDAFEAAKARAELEYSTRYERHANAPQLVDRALHHTILTQNVVLAYSTQARQACREGKWTVAKARQSAEVALQHFCDLYFVREFGDRSEGAKATHRVAFARVLYDEPRWKRHLSELAELAERSLSDSMKGSPTQVTAQDPIRMVRSGIETFAIESYVVRHDRIAEKYKKKLNRLPEEVRRTGNSGAFLPARIKLEKEHLGNLILARADAWREAFTHYGVPQI